MRRYLTPLAMAIVMLCEADTSRADLLYGVISHGQISYTNGPFAGQGWSTGTELQVTSYLSPLLSGSSSEQIALITATGGATANFSVDNGSLHASATGFATVSSLGCACNGEGAGSFYGSWHDTIHVFGLPIGTPVDLQFTNTLHSFTTLFGSPENQYNQATIDSFLSINGLTNAGAVGEADLSNYEGAANDMVTRSVIVHAHAGDELQVVHQLFGNALSNTLQPPNGGQVPVSRANVDALNTSDSFIDVLTAGASYGTASGVRYDAPATIPEPSGLGLAVGALIAGMIVLRRSRSLTARRKKKADSVIRVVALTPTIP